MWTLCIVLYCSTVLYSTVPKQKIVLYINMMGKESGAKPASEILRTDLF